MFSRTMLTSTTVCVLLFTSVSVDAANWRSPVVPLSSVRLYAPRRPQETHLSPSDARLRNDQRRRDLNTIANAMFAYTHDGHEIPKAVSMDPQDICKTSGPSCKGTLDLVSLLTPYLSQAQLPSDPSLPQSDLSTGYTVYTNGWRTKLYYGAPRTEGIMIRIHK